MSTIPEDIKSWMTKLRVEDEEELGEGEVREFVEMMNSKALRNGFRRVVKLQEAMEGQLQQLNVLEPTGQAEMLRLQGELRGLVRMFETLWETAHVST